MLKKKYLLSILFLLVSVSTAKAQVQSGASYEEIRERGESLLSSARYKEAIIYYRSYISSYPGKINFKIGIAYYYLQQYDSATTYFKRAEVWANQSGDTELLAMINSNSGAIYKRLGNFEESLKSYVKALKVYETLNDSASMAITHYNIALNYKELAVYEKAVNYLLKAEKWFDAQKVNDYLAKAYQSLGNILREQGDYDASLDYHKKALAIKNRSSDDADMVASLNDVANTYKKKEDYKEAEGYYRRALSFGVEEHKATLLDNLGEVMLRQNRLDSAGKYLHKSLVLRRANNNQKGIATTLTELGELYFKKGDHTKAAEFLAQSEKLAFQLNYKDVLLSNYKTQQLLLEATSRYKEANEVGKAYYKLDKELFNQERENIINGLRIAYETEQKEQQIEILSGDKKVQELNLRKEKQKNRYLITLAFLLMVISILAIFAYRNKQKLVRIEQKQVEIEQSLRLDTQHRTKNFLQTLISLLRFLEKQVKDKQARELLNENQKRVEAMIMINNSLGKKTGEDFMVFDFSSFLRELITNLKTSLLPNGKKIELQLILEDLSLSGKKANPLALIVNELITNAFKYGLLNNDHPELIVKLNKKGKDWMLVIHDNGPGLPENFEIDNLKSSGLRLIKMFAKQLDGDFVLKNEKGLKAELRFRV